MSTAAVLTPEVVAILDTAASLYALDRRELLYGTNEAPAPEARSRAMAELRDRHGWSHRRIGMLFGRDQSTVASALRRRPRS